MARLLIKAKVERKDPEESRLINAFSEAVKAVRSYAISRDTFVYQYNEWCQKIQPNITFLNESYQIFLERTSPSTLQRFFVTTFAAVCFLESIRNKNADCFFIGVFFCFLLILMSFITAIIGLLSTTPDKSAKSILNWILTMNVLSKEISHRLNRTSRVFQIIAGPDMLYTNSRETNHHTISRWNYFFRLFFLNFLYWFSIYGTAFAVQVCVILKVLSFMELTEVLKSFSLLIIFIDSLIQDIKIRRIRREIHYQICCLDSETENFLSCFHDRSNLGPLLEQYEFLKEPLLNTLKCGNDFDKITSSHSFILFAITVIKVSDGLQDSIYSENLQTILQCLLFNDPNMCSKTKLELTSDKTPDIPSVLQTTKDLADCFLQLGTVLKESKLASSIPVESKKENKSSAILQKILNPKETLPAEKKSSKKQLKKSKIPKKIPEDFNRHSVGNKKDKLNKISDTVTKDRHIKENESENTLKITSKVAESEDFDSEKNKPLTSLDILSSSLLVTMEKPQEIDLNPESEVDDGDTCTINSDIKENKKRQNFLKSTFKATESDGFNSEENKLPTSLNDMPSPLLATMEKHERFDHSPKSEANYGDALMKNSDKMKSENNKDLQNEQSNPPKDLTLHSSLAQEVLNRERENEQSNLLKDMILHSIFYQEVPNDEGKNKQLNRPKDVILHSTLDQEVVNDEEENEQSNLSNDMVLHSSLVQKVLSDEGENEDSSIPENTVLHSRHTQEISGEESNTEIPSPVDDTVLHSPLVRKDVDENENKTVPAPEETDLSETNQNASIPFQNAEHDDMKIGVSCRTRDTDSDSRAISNALDKDDSDGQTAENKTVVENFSPVNEIKIPLIPSKEEGLLNDLTSASSSIKQTNGKKDVDFAQQSRKCDNIGRIEHSETTKGRASKNKTALKEAPVKTDVAISKRNFMTVNPDFNRDIVTAETDETANANFKNSDETFHTIEDESSSAVETHPNPEVRTPEKIHLQEIKLEDDDFEAGILESGRDKNVKSIYLDKTFIDQSNSLSYVGFDGKIITNHQNGYQQSVEDNEQNLDKTVSEEILRETVRQFFEHQNLVNRPVQMPIYDTSKQNQESITNFKDIKSKSKETILHQDTNVHSHPKNASLRHEAPDYFTQANTSAEGDDKADLEFSRHSYLKKKQLKSRAKSVLKSKGKQRKRKTLSGNNSVLEDPSADVSGSEKSIDSNDAKSATSDNTSTSNMSNFGELPIENQESAQPDHLSILNSMMQGLSIDSQKQEPSNNQNNSIVVNEENNLKSKSNCFSFGSTELLVDDSEKEKPSNNILERGTLESLGFPIQSLDKLCVEQRKEKEKISDNGSNTFIFGTPKLPMSDSEKPSNNILERNRSDTYANANKDHHETDFSKEKEKTSNNTSNAFTFRSSKLPMKDSEKPSRNILEINPFHSYAITNNYHHEADLKQFSNEGSYNWLSEQNSKEKEKTSNNKSNNSLLGSTQLSMKDPIQEKLSYMSFRFPSESFATANKVHHKTALQESPVDRFEKSCVKKYSKGKEKTSNSKSKFSEFSSTESSTKDSENEELYNNSFQRSLFENFTNKIEDSAGFCGQEFPKGSLSKRNVEQNSDHFAFIGSFMETFSKEPDQHNASNKTGVLLKSIKNKETKSRVKPKTLEENNASSNGMVTGPPKISAATLTTSEEEIENQAERNMRKAIQKRTFGDFVFESTIPSNQLSFNPTFDLYSHKEDKSYTGKENEFFDSDQNGHSNQEETQSSNDKVNKTCNGRKSEIFNDEANEPYNGKTNGPSNSQANEHFSNKENESCRHEEKESSSKIENGQCKGQRYQYSSNKEMELCNSEKNKPFSREENRYPDSKHDEPLNDEENKSDADIQIVLCNGQAKQISNNIENKPYSFQENESYSEMIENASPDGKLNNMNAEENVPSIVQGNQTSSNKENKPCSSEENRPCSGIEIASPEGKQNKSFNAEENGPRSENGNHISSNNEIKPYSSEENGPCIGTENATPGGKQNKSLNAEENGPRSENGNHISSNNEIKPYSSEENGSCIGTENATPGGKQNKSFNAEENGPINDQGNQLSSNKEDKSCSSDKNGPCIGTEKATPGGKQNKPFNAEENGPISDQGNQLSSNKEDKSCSFLENGPYSGVENASTHGKQNKSVNAEENASSSYPEKPTSINKESGHFNAEANQSYIAGENEPYNPEGNEFHSSESNVRSSDENESFSDEENEFCDAQENGPWNDKEKEIFDAKGNKPCSIVQKKPCNNEMYEPCRGGENQTYKVEENKKVSSLLKESPTNISSNTNDEQSFSAECFFSKEGSELRNSQDSEAIQAETETLVNSTNGSAGLRVPTRADLKNMTEKEPHSLESSATSELKNETFILSESEVLLKNDEAVKERMTSRQSQKMQTHHAEIPDASPDADNLNQSNMQSKKGGEGADIMTDSGFCDTGHDISSLQKFRQNSESDTFQSNEDELGKERSSNNFEENSHLFVSDKNGTSTHLDHTLADANSSECPSSENKECNNFNTEGDLVLPEDSRMNSTQINENIELNQRFSADENQRNIEHRSKNEEVADQYSGTVSEYAEYSLKSKSVELPAADLSELSTTKPAGLSTSEVAELTTSELPDSGHKKCGDFNSEDTSVLSEDYRMNSIHEDENTNLNLGLLFDENEYHVEHRSNNEEVAGQHSGTVSKSAECSSETESSKPTELPDSEPSEFPTSKLVESSSSVQKECGDFQSEDTSMLSENCRMNSTQIDENRDLNLGFSFDENNHSNNEEVADQHSGIGSEREEYSSESKSPKSGILNKGSVKRFRKKHKIKERRSSGVKRDSSDSDSRQHTLWDSDLGSRVFQERAVQRSARKANTSECIENVCHIESHSNNEVVADQYSGTTSKGTTYSSSSESVIVPVNTSENGAAVSEQNQIVSEQREGYYTRDQAPVCSLRYKNLDVDIFPPLSRLKLKLVCQNNKTQTNSENNETRMSETSSVSQSMNSEDSVTSEFQSDDGSTEQNVSQEAVSQSSGVIKKYESKPLHFEDRNVSLNYSKRRASLNYSHSSSNGNEITFKSKNTKLYINTENIDQSE